MFGCNYEALSLTVAPTGNELAAAPSLLTDIASSSATGLRQTCIAAMASVAIHGLLVIALIIVAAYALPTSPQETVTTLVNHYLSGVNYFFRSTTTILPDRRQLQALRMPDPRLD
jgi:hypothetical protein